MSTLSLLELIDPQADPQAPLRGEVTGRHYQTGEGIRIGWEHGVITSLSPAPLEKEGTAELPWIAPALVDLQVNGYGGIDYQRDDVDEAALLASIRALRRDGCARILLTLITRPWPELLANLRRIKALRDGNELLRQTIFGWHIEGPFLSAEPGFVGAHPEEAICDPTPEAIDALREAAGSDPVLLTLAAERNGAPAAIRRARELGIVVSMGHSNASKAAIREAVTAGAVAYTHLGNGCPQQLDRHDNILWRILDEPSLTLGIIPDGIHVTPQLFRLFHRVAPADKIYWTTDAMAGAGAAPGVFTIGRLEIEVGADRVARQPGRSNFAGSALEPLRGVSHGASMLGKPWQAVWDHFSVTPSRLMGLGLNRRVELAVGAEAVFCLLKES